jgi:hypothetical protein
MNDFSSIRKATFRKPSRRDADTSVTINVAPQSSGGVRPVPIPVRPPAGVTAGRVPIPAGRVPVPSRRGGGRGR